MFTINKRDGADWLGVFSSGGSQWQLGSGASLMDFERREAQKTGSLWKEMDAKALKDGNHARVRVLRRCSRASAAFQVPGCLFAFPSSEF
jgi:hypothetical protein